MMACDCYLDECRCAEAPVEAPRVTNLHAIIDRAHDHGKICERLGYDSRAAAFGPLVELVRKFVDHMADDARYSDEECAVVGVELARVVGRVVEE